MSKRKLNFGPTFFYNFFAVFVLLGALVKFTTDWTKFTVWALAIGFIGEMITFLYAAILALKEPKDNRDADDVVATTNIQVSDASIRMLEENLNALGKELTSFSQQIATLSDNIKRLKGKTDTVIDVFK